ncbi:MAG: lipase maturation factor family protein [bacterium]
MMILENLETDAYWYGRFLFYRGLFLTYLLAFLVTHRQFIPLAGEDGILPFTERVRKTSVTKNPTILAFFPTDTAVRILTYIGLLLSFAGFLGVEWLGFWAVSLISFVLWAAYLSIMNAGGLFYGYGWESFLVETGFLGIFLGSAYQKVSLVMVTLSGWLLFRVMFGAGLIKIRGDTCWRDLTCMDYHYETQPMPNPLSWFAHHMPGWWHKLEVLGNHLTELIVPFCYVLPQPYAGVGAALTVLFQGWLMLTGNFSWLNFLTIIVALPLIPDRAYAYLSWTIEPASLSSIPIYQHSAILVYALLVVVLSYWPVRNFFSSRQLMNASFDPLNLVNTYGAFGSITKKRYELVIEGRNQGQEWVSYEFKGKPTDPERCPAQWAPYHLRLDWQLWFAAMRNRPRYWLLELIRKLFEDNNFHRLLAEDPFRDEDGPDEIRIRRFVYSFTSPGEWSDTGRWWKRRFTESVVPPIGPEEIEHRLR